MLYSYAVMGAKDVKSMGINIGMILSVIGVAFFANAITSTGAIQKKQPTIGESAVLSKVSPRDIPSTVVVNTDESGQNDGTEQDGETALDDSDTPTNDENDTTDGTTSPDQNTPDTLPQADTDELATDAPAPGVNRAITIPFELNYSAQQDDTITVVSDAVGHELNGECTFALTLDGATIRRSVPALTNACKAVLPVASFTESGEWSVTHSYTANNGTKRGSGGPYGVAVTLPLPDTPLEFTAINGGQDGDLIRINGEISTVASGVCTYTFVNTDAVLSVSNQISSGQTCATTVDVSAFTLSGTYTLVVSLETTGGQSVQSAPLPMTILVPEQAPSEQITPETTGA